MATKQKEREALAKITAIIKELGPESYIGFAFEGCLSDAADNIENDFANSMKQRYESAEKARSLMESQVLDLKDKLAEARKDAAGMAEQLTETRAKVIPHDLYQRLWLVVESQEQNAEKEMLSIASVLADLQDPTADGVAHSIKALADAKARRLDAAALLSALEKYENK